MKIATKKLAAFLLVTAITTTTAGNVYATEPESKAYLLETGCDSVIEIEPYIAEIGGEECVVINLSGLASNDVNISDNDSVQSKENSLGISPLSEKNKIYSDTVNLTNGDYSSPEISCSPTEGFTMRVQSALINADVKICMHLFSNNINHFVPTVERVLVFSLFFTERDLKIILEPGRDISKCRLEIFKDGTTLSSPFSYTLYEY